MNRSGTAARLVLLAALLGSARTARAESAAALVMPFDTTAGSVSFLVASHPRSSAAPSGVRTHWTFWGDDCTPLLDVVRCLPPDGSLVLDPTSVPDVADGAALVGRRGFATVVAYGVDGSCAADDRAGGVLAPEALLGSFTLADVASGASFGGAALALPADPGAAFVDVGASAADGALRQAALRLQSFTPASLDVSRVILLAIAERAGAGEVGRVEPGPAVVEDDERVRAGLRFATSDGVSVPLRDAQLGCATFTSLRPDDEPTLLVPADGAPIASGGMLVVEQPHVGDRPLGATSVLLGFHAQAVGSFGVLAVGDASFEAATQPSPGVSPSTTPATPTVRPSSSASPRPSATPAATATRTASPATPRPSASIVAPTPSASATLPPTPLPSGSATTPSPRPSGGVATPSPRPTGSATATPAGTPTPRATPTATPAATAPTPAATRTPLRTPSPRPSVAATATPPPTPTPTPRATASASPTPGSCSTLTLQVRTSYSAGDVSGVLATVSYPASLSLPGSGSDASVLARVSNVSGTSGLFSATDTDTTVRVGLVSVSSAVPAGAFVRIAFDCVTGSTPPASAFGCTVEASTLDGTLVSGATCTTEVLS